MKVTVVAILETEFKQEQALAKIMNNRLQRAAKELQDFHFAGLSVRRSSAHYLTVQLSYNQKYKIRYRIMNDVPSDVEFLVAESCSRLGYILWKSMVAEHTRQAW
ncbi:hypothetical protein [Pedobacter miscanthi]|uniref:Uncharacterized protein n=1 Tax=Pedobacter miscanthi TaxID=2259170 RepID=A0A366LC06_9SPHI|nr:hypothetical protein [Pedobacter miscanthi]RBQ11425.1 hypothetical protein DRW42_02890 [Pedobacter miscanthi]